jgi:hypothetical protein
MYYIVYLVWFEIDFESIESMEGPTCWSGLEKKDGEDLREWKVCCRKGKVASDDSGDRCFWMVGMERLVVVWNDIGNGSSVSVWGRDGLS